MDQKFTFYLGHAYKLCLYTVVSTFLNENDMRWLVGHLLAQLSNHRHAPLIKHEITDRRVQWDSGLKKMEHTYSSTCTPVLGLLVLVPRICSRMWFSTVYMYT